MKVMVVDDEPSVLRDLERGLRRRLASIDVHTFSDGSKALDALAAAPFDVIITDMLMPGVSGRDLLERARDAWPGMVRFAHSGHIDRDNLAEAERAHQIFLKPCPSDVFAQALVQAMTLRELANAPWLRSIPDFGACPLLVEFEHTSKNWRTAANAVLQGLERHPSARALLLRLAAALPGAESTRGEVALAHLKPRLLRGLLIVTCLLERLPALERRRMEERHVRRIRAGAAISQAAEPLLATLLCDVGAMALAHHAPARSEEIERLVAQGAGRHLSERRVLGVSCGEAGAVLLVGAGFPINVANAVRGHQQPGGHTSDDRLTAITHIASLAADGRRAADAVVGPFVADAVAMIDAALDGAGPAPALSSAESGS